MNDHDRDGREPGRYTVHDRRHWAQHEEGAAPDAIEERKPTYVENLEAKLAEKDQEIRRYAGEYREALVGLEQAKARIERESAREVARQKRNLLIELLPVADDLERALAAARELGGVEAVLAGVEHVLRGFIARLERLGAVRVDPIGERFDPARHEAVAIVPVRQPEQDGAVVAVTRPGYFFGEELLRPAEVVVGKLAS